MIGQEALIAKLKSYSIATLPHTMLFVGESGCGKHTLVKELTDYFNIDAIDISDVISLDTINDIFEKTVATFYIIDSSKIDEKKQNIILKFLEEPPVYAYIIVLCENKSMILQTVANRCIDFEFEPYTKTQLRQFMTEDDEHILDVCSTPGQVKSLHSGDLKELESLCEKIVTKLNIANFANTLKITNKINLKDEYDKFDIKVFFNMLLITIKNEYAKNHDNKTYLMYNLVSEYKKRLRDSRLNLEMFMNNFLTTLWEFAN